MMPEAFLIRILVAILIDQPPPLQLKRAAYQANTDMHQNICTAPGPGQAISHLEDTCRTEHHLCKIKMSRTELCLSHSLVRHKLPEKGDPVFMASTTKV